MRKQQGVAEANKTELKVDNLSGKNAVYKSKRTALLDEAAQTLNKRGLSHTSLATVAANVGISRSAVYYYVDDLRDLVYRCYRQTCEQLAGLVHEACEKYDDEIDIICSFIAAALNEDRAELASLSELAYLHDDQRNGIIGLYKGVRLLLAEILNRGIERKKIRPLDVQVNASILLSLVFWVPVIKRWPGAREVSKSEFGEVIQQIIRVGLSKQRDGEFHCVPFDFDPFIGNSGNAFSVETKAAARRETLLASASWSFNQKGVDATSLDEIAERVGVSKKVIYNNVGNKENLIAECYKRAFRLFEYVSSQIVAYDGTRLDALCAGMVSLAVANSRPDVAPLVPMTGHDSWPEEVRTELQAAQIRLMDMHLSVYEKGHEEGSLRRFNDLCVIFVVPGLYDWMSQWLDTLPESERERAPYQVANFLRLGLSSI